MCSVNFWHQQNSNSLFKGSIGHVTSQCKWPIKYWTSQNQIDRALACSRLSDGGEDAEDWARRETEMYAKVGIFMFALSQYPRTGLSRNLEQANRASPVQNYIQHSEIFSSQHPENHTLFGGTYPFGTKKRAPPPPTPLGRVLAVLSVANNKIEQVGAYRTYVFLDK